MSDVKPPRAVQSDVTATFLGIISLQLDVIPVKLPDARPSTKTACPTCKDAHPLSQRYICNEDDSHGPFEQADVHHCVEVEKGVFRKVSEEQLASLKETTLPPGEATFTVFAAADVEAATLPSGTTYRLRPKKPTGATKKSYALLVDLLNDPSQAWICELTMRNVQNMYRAFTRDGVITLMQLIRPGELHAAQPVEAEYDTAMLDLARQLAGDTVAEFDGAAYLNTTRERAEHLKAALADPDAPTFEPKAVPATVVDDTSTLMALLQASVQATEAAKEPAKPKRSRTKVSA